MPRKVLPFKDSTEFDKKSWAYQYQLSSNKLKSLEQNIASLNSNLLYIESVKWMRENEKRLKLQKQEVLVLFGHVD